MFCPKCGNKIAEDAKFCGACGNPIGAPAQPETPRQESYAAPEAAPQNTAPQYGAPQDGAPQYGAPAQPAYGMNQFYAAPPAPEKKKKTGRKVLISVVSVVAALALVVGLAFVIFPKQAKAIFAKIFYSDTKYYKTLENDELGKLASDAAEYFSDAEDYKNGDQKLPNKLTLNAKIDSSILDSVAASSGMNLDFLSDIGLKYNMDTKEDVNAGVFELLLGGGKLISADYRYDTTNKKLYIAFPELSDKFIALDSEDLSSLMSLTSGLKGVPGLGDDDEDSVFGLNLSGLGSYATVGGEVFGKMGDIFESVTGDLTAKDVEKLVTKIGEVVIDNIGEVTKSEEEVTIGGVNQKLTVFKAALTERDVNVVKKALLEMVRDDEDIHRILKDAVFPIVATLEGDGEFDEDQLFDEMINSIDEMLETLDEYMDKLDDKDILVDYKMYATSSGDVVGHAIEVDDYADSMPGLKITYIKTEADGKTAYELSIRTPDKTYGGLEYGLDDLASQAESREIKLVFVGEEKGDLLTGEVSVYTKVEDEMKKVMTLDLEGFDKEAIKKGHLNGKITISPEADGTEMISDIAPGKYASSMQLLTQFKLSLNFAYEGGVQKIDAAVKMLGKDVVTLEGMLEWDRGGVDTKLPNSGDCYDFKDMDDLSDWTKTLDFNSFLKELRQNGVPSAICDKIEGMIQGTLYEEDDD